MCDARRAAGAPPAAAIIAATALVRRPPRRMRPEPTGLPSQDPVTLATARLLADLRVPLAPRDETVERERQRGEDAQRQGRAPLAVHLGAVGSQCAALLTCIFADVDAMRDLGARRECGF